MNTSEHVTKHLKSELLVELRVNLIFFGTTKSVRNKWFLREKKVEPRLHMNKVHSLFWFVKELFVTKTSVVKLVGPKFGEVSRKKDVIYPVTRVAGKSKKGWNSSILMYLRFT